MIWQELTEERKRYFDVKDAELEKIQADIETTFLYETMKLAGVILKKEEFQEIIREKRHPRETKALRVWDFYQAFLFIQTKAAAKHRLTMELTQKVAEKVMKHTGKEETTSVGRYDSSLGDFRLGEDYNETYPLADYRDIPDLLEKLCGDIDSRAIKIRGIETIKLAADFMYEFSHIKPFGYGNIETGLLLMNYVQLLHREPLIVIFAEEQARFLEALQWTEYHPTPEIFENFIVKGQLKLLKTTYRKENKKG